MIKTTNIDDYVSLQALKNYCYSHGKMTAKTVS